MPGSERFPVRLHRGSFWQPPRADLFVRGFGLDAFFGRTYSTVDRDELAGFGKGWTGTFDIWVEDVSVASGAINVAEFSLGNGFITQFHRDSGSSDEFSGDGWSFKPLYEQTGTAPLKGKFTIAFGDGITWEFEEFEWSQTGRQRAKITKILDRFGNCIRFAYGTAPNVDEITLSNSTDSDQHVFTITRNGAGRVISVTDETSRTVSYTYSGDLLESVTYPDASSVSYTYDGDLLETITDAESNALVTVAYGSGEKVSSLTLDDGIINLHYEDEFRFGELVHRKAIVNDAMGNVIEFDYKVFSVLLDDLYNDGWELESIKRYTGRAPDAGAVTTMTENRPSATPVGHAEEPTYYETRFTYSPTNVGGRWLDNRIATINFPDGVEVVYTYFPPSEWEKRHLARTVTISSDDGKTLVQTLQYQHESDSAALPGSRFGEQFVTREILNASSGQVLRGLSRCYGINTHGDFVLEGIDYDGLPEYGTCASALSMLSEDPGSGIWDLLVESGGSLVGGTMDLLFGADELYETASPQGGSDLPESALIEPVMDGTLHQLFESATIYDFEEEASFSSGTPMMMGGPSVAHHDEFLYNEHGQLTEHLHPDNDEDDESSSKVRSRDVYTYTDGYLTGQTIDSGGLNLTTRFENDAVGRVEYITAPNVTFAVSDENKKTTITYDELDRVTMVEAPQIVTTTVYRPTTDYAYDENGNLTRTRHHWTDKDGAPKSTAGESEASSYLATEYGYDTRNRLNAISREDGTGLTVSKIEYDGNGNVVKRLSPLAVTNTDPNNVVTYEYDVRDLPIRIKRGNALATRIDYDAGGRVVRMVEGYGTPEARSASTAYDGLGHIQSTLDAAGLTTEYTTDALGRVVKTVAKDGPNVLAHMDYAYDLAGRLTNINKRHWDATGASIGDGWLRTVLAYTDAGMLLSEKVEGDVTSHLYDTAMRLEQVNSPGGNRQNYAYDANGNRLTATEHAYDTAADAETVFITRYGYDPLDRLVSMGHDNGDGVQNDANTTGYAYDSLGQLEEIEDALGNLTVNAYDPLGRLDSTTRDPGAHPHIDAVVDYEYDANDRLTEVTDPNGGVTNYIYDDLNRHVETVYADGQRERFTYDALDNVVEHIAPGGLATHTAFDAAGRPVAQHYTSLSGRMDPGETTWTYDVLGRVREAKNAGSTVSHAYDSLGNPAIERVRYGSKLLEPVKREYDQKGLLESINPPGTENEVKYTRNADGLVEDVKRNGAVLANFGYLGARPNARELVNGGTALGGTMIGYEDTGLRPGTIAHGSATIATVDTRTFAWDKAYNLDGFQVTGGSLAASAVDLDYDGINRLKPASIGATWVLDDAGNRTGTDYSLDGQDALMHRYTSVATLPQYHDPQGALVKVEEDVDSVKEYHYDVNSRLVHYREATLASISAFPDLPAPGSDPDDSPNWQVVNGTWSINDNDLIADPSDDYLEMTPGDIGAILYLPSPHPDNGFTFKYRSAHAPTNPDGNGTPEQFRSSDYPARYYAQALLSVDTSAAPPYPYIALRIEPDRLSVVGYDGAEFHELDSAQVPTSANTWYTVQLRIVAGGPDGAFLSVERTSPSAGDAVAVLMQSVPLSALPDIEGTAIGFTVGEDANYDFQLDAYAAAPDVAETFIDWDYDAYGRKIAETAYDNTNTVTSQTVYVYDGWRLVSELDALHSYRVVAEYIPGPAYVDDTVAARRDINRDGDFGDTNEGFLYYLTDQQYSTVALLDETGAVVERYGYDHFGAPSIYNADATATLS